jgi:hypothetical protein
VWLSIHIKYSLLINVNPEHVSVKYWALLLYTYAWAFVYIGKNFRSDYVVFFFVVLFLVVYQSIAVIF